MLMLILMLCTRTFLITAVSPETIKIHELEVIGGNVVEDVETRQVTKDAAGNMLGDFS